MPRIQEQRALGFGICLVLSKHTSWEASGCLYDHVGTEWAEIHQTFIWIRLVVVRNWVHLHQSARLFYFELSEGHSSGFFLQGPGVKFGID